MIGAVDMKTDLQNYANQMYKLAAQLARESTYGELNNEQRRYVYKIQQQSADFVEQSELLLNLKPDMALQSLHGDLTEMATFLLGHAELLNLQVIGKLNDQQSVLVHQLCESGLELQNEVKAICTQLPC